MKVFTLAAIDSEPSDRNTFVGRARLTRMNDAARQADLSWLRSEVRTLSDRVGRLPGTGALVLTAIITAVLTVALMVAVQRLNLDRMLPHSVGGQSQTAPANPPASNP